MKPQLNENSKCLMCKKGRIQKRHGKYGAFGGCNKYPMCPFTCKLKPIQLEINKFVGEE